MMKNKIFLALMILGFFTFFKSQTITLKQLSECQAGLYPCPSYEYAKDTNNLLRKYVGIWKGTYSDGRAYEFHFVKKNDDGEANERKWDILLGRLLIKDVNNQILINTLNVSNENTLFSGFFFDKELKKYQLYYSGNADCNDKGYVYVSFPDPTNLTQMELVFVQDRDVIASCSNAYKTVMPSGKKIILTKQ